MSTADPRSDGPPRDRFVGLFADEAETRLRRISEQILLLESNPSAEVVAAILRDAHSLKGAAAVVGLTQLSTLTHRVEDTLEPHRDGQGASADLIDRLLRVVDGLQEMLPMIRRGEDTAQTVAALLTVLDGGSAPTAPAAPVSAPADAPPPAPAPAPEPTPIKAPVPVVAPAHVESVATAPPSAPAPPVTATAPTAEVIELPASRVDEIVRSVGESAATNLRLGRLIADELGRDPESITEYRDLSRTIRHLHEKAVRARMVPVGSISGRLHRAVRDVARSGDKQVAWTVVGDDTELDRAVLQQLTDPLLHIVRNAVDHGIETPAERAAAGKPEQATVHFAARQLGADVVLSIVDDGRGIDLARLRAEAERRGVDTSAMTDDDVRDLIFASGVSTASTISQTSGRGVGLDVARASIERLRGRVDVLSTLGSGTEFRIVVPVAAAVLPCLLIDAGGQRFALPMSTVVAVQPPDARTITRAQGMQRIWVGDTVVALASLAETLGLDGEDDGPVVVIAHGERMAAFQVGALVGQRDVMVTGLGPFVPVLELVNGASVEADGSIITVLDGAALAQVPRGALVRPKPATDSPPVEAVAKTASVLVADDALPVRELQRTILEDAGYRVVVAEDGADALAALARERVDLVLTDVDMPRMNGFELTRAIRAHPQLANVPVVILSSKSSAADHQEGLEAGADAYIVKDAFGEATLLSAVERLLGRAS